MEISYSHRFIFIHTYRVAGTSISAALKPYSYVPGRFLIQVPLLRRLLKQRIASSRKWLEHNHGHAKAKELKAALPPKVFDNFYKFTFVRNPWDWHVSIYNFVLQRSYHPSHDLFKAFGSFENYLAWVIDDQGAEQQKEFVTNDSGELIVDFIGHYETLNEDFEMVCSRLGIKSSLPHENRSTHKDFRQYYTPQTKALVAEAYKEDIDFFGYDFDEQKSLPPILGRAEIERRDRHSTAPAERM